MNDSEKEIRNYIQSGMDDYKKTTKRRKIWSIIIDILVWMVLAALLFFLIYIWS